MCGWAGDAFSSTDRAQAGQGIAAGCAQAGALRNALTNLVFPVFSTGFCPLYFCNNSL